MELTIADLAFHGQALIRGMVHAGHQPPDNNELCRVFHPHLYGSVRVIATCTVCEVECYSEIDDLEVRMRVAKCAGAFGKRTMDAPLAEVAP